MPFIPDFNNGDQVTDSYTKGGNSLIWDASIPINQTSANILGHITPSRTYALGQTPTNIGSSVIGSVVNLNNEPGFKGFGASNQGHSAQFYDSYLNRKGYWERVLEEFDFVLE